MIVFNGSDDDAREVAACVYGGPTCRCCTEPPAEPIVQAGDDLNFWLSAPPMRLPIYDGPAGIGDPVAPERVAQGLCGLVSALPDPERFGEKCEQAAELHLLVKDHQRGSLHELMSCMSHYLVAIRAGEVVVDHEVGQWCGRPDSRFDRERNTCVVNDCGCRP